MFETYILPVLMFAVMGLVAGILLTVVSKLFEVKTDPRTEEVNEALPQINCGACGYSGCSDYAKAIVEKGAPTNLCRPGGAKVAAKVNDIMGGDASMEISKEIAKDVKAVVKDNYVIDWVTNQSKTNDIQRAIKLMIIKKYAKRIPRDVREKIMEPLLNLAKIHFDVLN